ncbi:dTDP-4-dehydrorhamnose 3,5-epimerase [Streptomyces sp. MnatMP-M77]|uniref:dTDP-4-dehydrorhamnose 3,5-epimerase family protein n=1 Tax=Streptomyces TaxID=1883 RepID=UPI000805E083|nr:dTDP-4-dehydrorhamnose 3,5-epimerase [Streptomyces sp. MnatMP-M77]MYT82965.1 dTDP-4-dehydrorhamnose 3,5-epimerase [Streptomyces sp. SID8364]SBU95111.1 dTDP-4-dehydrorhamnose 3,5-epimerase [Streptomyces sp. MnatMP-M77]
MRPLSVQGAWLSETRAFADDRGEFQELYSARSLRGALGYDPGVAQVNRSVSRRGVLRGVHFAQLPPSQAKYVTCLSGAVLDVVVDIRTGSPTYRAWEAVRLDDPHRSLYVEAGLGHSFMALTDDAVVVYLTSQGYAAGREHGVHPLDPDLGIAWPDGIEPVLSEKDRQAPGIAEMERRGLLPDYEECLAFRRSLCERGPG